MIRRESRGSQIYTLESLRNACRKETVTCSLSLSHSFSFSFSFIFNGQKQTQKHKQKQKHKKGRRRNVRESKWYGNGLLYDWHLSDSRPPPLLMPPPQLCLSLLSPLLFPLLPISPPSYQISLPIHFSRIKKNIYHKNYFFFKKIFNIKIIYTKKKIIT